MENWFFGMIASFAVEYWLFRSKVNLEFYYKRQEKDDNVIIRFVFLDGRLPYTLRIPVIEINRRGGMPWVESEIESSKGDVETHAHQEKQNVKQSIAYYLQHPEKLQSAFEMFQQFVSQYCHLINRMTAVLVCEEMSLWIRFGTEDAALTGMSAGVLWSILSSYISALTKRVRFNASPTIRVCPTFEQACLEVEVRCIFSTSLGKLISAISKQISWKRKGGSAR